MFKQTFKTGADPEILKRAFQFYSYCVEGQKQPAAIIKYEAALPVGKVLMCITLADFMTHRTTHRLIWSAHYC